MDLNVSTRFETIVMTQSPLWVIQYKAPCGRHIDRQVVERSGTPASEKESSELAPEGRHNTKPRKGDTLIGRWWRETEPLHQKRDHQNQPSRGDTTQSPVGVIHIFQDEFVPPLQG